jgi:hypothetical protein
VRALLVFLVACAPAVDGPLDRQRAADRDDADRLAVQLAALPGVVSAHATLHRPLRDPLTTRPPSPASGALLLITDDQADRTAIESDARRLLRATAPEIPDPAIIVEVGGTRPDVAAVGPFRVLAGSRRALAATLVAALATIAALAGWIMWRERSYARRGTSAQ